MRIKTALKSLGTIVSTLICLVWVATPASNAATNFSKSELNTVRQITDYFNSIRSMKGKFTQISPSGRVASGTFFIVKPGMMRFEYAAPNPLLIVSDGTWVTVKNRARKKADQYPLTSTPLRLILEKNVNLFKETKIQEIRESPEIASVTLRDTSVFASGSLTLIFDRKNKAIQQWVVVDERGRRTAVTLSDIEKGVSADPKLFKIKIPKSRRQIEREQDRN